jgi:hypothetical protein
MTSLFVCLHKCTYVSMYTFLSFRVFLYTTSVDLRHVAFVCVYVSGYMYVRAHEYMDVYMSYIFLCVAYVCM